MEFKGTNQEWFIGENQSTIISKDSCLIARVFDGRGNSLLYKKEQSNEIVYANAKLIACAPEMLELLQLIVECLSQENEIEYYQKKAKQLIKKATE